MHDIPAGLRSTDVNRECHGPAIGQQTFLMPSYRSYHINNNNYQHPILPFPSEFPKADRIGDVQKPGWHDHVRPRRAAVAIPAVTLSTHYSPPWAMASGMHRLQHSNHLTGRANSNHWILHPGPQRAGATIRLQ